MLILLFASWELGLSSINTALWSTLTLLSLAIVKIMSSQNKALLILLSLEVISLTLFLCLMFKMLPIAPVFIFSYLVMMVCEAAVGLSLLIRTSRNKGNDYL
uniref:NADH-ubiquinone oxidoreductase chain 4L n=1 Tax=Schizopera knabeni TaxID=1432316 RepID=W8DNB1_9MAXI|nr:NADH dehydrogenase subunit 4L [Schizopera knabeni]